MFCTQCGQPLGENTNFCTNCGAKISAEPAPNVCEQPAPTPVAEVVSQPQMAEVPAPVVQAPVEEVAPVVQAPVQEAAPEMAFAQVEFDAAPAPKKKGKKGVVLAIVAVLLAAAGVATFLFWDTIVGLFKKEATPVDTFRQVETQAMAETANAISNAYNALITNGGSVNLDGKTTMKLQLSETILQSLSTAAGMDLSWLDEVSIDMDVAMDGELYGLDMTFRLGGAKIVKVSAVMDSEIGLVYLALPELSDTYLYTYTEGFEGGNYMLQNMLQDEALLNALPDQQTVNTLLNRYMGIVLQNISKVKQETIKLQVGGMEQDVQALRCELTQKDLLKIFKAVLKEAKKDEDLKKCIENLQNYISMRVMYASDAYTMFQQGVDSALAELEEAEATSEVMLVLTDYVSKADGTLIGRKLEAEGQQILEITHLTDETGFATKLDVAGRLLIEGAGTIDGAMQQGNYTLTVAGEEYLVATVAYDTQKWAQGELDGRIRLTPTAALLDAMGLNYQIKSMVSAMNLSLELIGKGKENTGSYAINVFSGNELLVGMSFDSTIGENREVLIPTNSMDANYAEQWAETVNYEKLIQDLKNSPVPAELVNSLEAMLFPAEAPESALEILETVWASYGEEEKFAVFGGNQNENANMEGPGAFDTTDTDGLSYMLLVPEQWHYYVQDAASMTHAMMANNFTCGVYRVEDVNGFADAMWSAVTGNQWMCGMPERLHIAVIDGTYVVVTFGVEDAVVPFRDKLMAAYPTATEVRFIGLE